jgi:hypothetical protein
MPSDQCLTSDAFLQRSKHLTGQRPIGSGNRRPMSVCRELRKLKSTVSAFQRPACVAISTGATAALTNSDTRYGGCHFACAEGLKEHLTGLPVLTELLATAAIVLRECDGADERQRRKSDGLQASKTPTHVERHIEISNTLSSSGDLSRPNLLVFSHFPSSRLKVHFGESNALGG